MMTERKSRDSGPPDGGPTPPDVNRATAEPSGAAPPSATGTRPGRGQVRGRGRPRRNLSPKYQPLRIRQWREKLGLTQTQLGERMGKHAGLISRLECGITPYNQAHVEALVTALGIEIHQLFTGPPSTEDQQIHEVLARLADPARKRQMLGVIRALVPEAA